MGTHIYLREKVGKLLRDRAQRYKHELEDPEDLNEVIRLLVFEADRARRLDAALVDGGREAVASVIHDR